MVPPGIPTTVLVAPDAFKGSFDAPAVASAIGRGLEQARVEVDRCPVADGGEGTLDVLAETLGAETQTVVVSDPLGRELEALFALAPAPARRGRRSARPTQREDGATAIVETAAASGLDLVSPAERDPIEASTFGTGQLIAAALEAGARTVLIGAGGSATTDGGAGAIEALRRAGVDDGVRLVVLCDVRTPFEEAAHVYAPQKGASAEQVRRLTARLNALARAHGDRDPRGMPMTGAAGGLSGGLWAAFGAELQAGAPFVLDALGFDHRLRRARAVVAGEGKLDEQSLAGKAISEVATRARQSGVPCHAIVGMRALDSFGARVLDLQAVLEASSLRQLQAAGRRLAAVL